MIAPQHDASDVPDAPDSADSPWGDRCVSSPTLSARTFLIGFIAILVATAVFSFFIARKVRHDAHALTDQVRLVGAAIVAYSTTHGAFPSDRETLEAFVTRDGLGAPIGDVAPAPDATLSGRGEPARRLGAALDRVTVTWPELAGAAPQLSVGGRPVRLGVVDEVQGLLDAEAVRLVEPDAAIP